MDPQFEGLTEDELRKMLDAAENYDERAKIRSALRTLKKATGKDRKMTGASVYRRPGFQAPKTVQIPNSVTGNVLPQTLKDGESVKPPDKHTPTIGYLNATTTVTPKRAGKNPKSSQSAGNPSSMSEQESWWRKSESSRSSRSQTPSDILEQKTQQSEEGDSHDQVFNDSTNFTSSDLRPNTPELQKEPTPEPPKEPTPEPPKEQTPEPLREPTPEHLREPISEPPKERTPEPPSEPTPEPPKEPSPEPPREPTPESPREPTPEPETLEESEYTEDVQDEEDEEEEDEDENDEDEQERFSNDEDDELRALEDDQSSQQVSGSNLELAAQKSIPIEVLQEVEPGLEENKDFRKKLHKTGETKIDTKAAFPSQKSKAEQIDFRNVLKKATGPEKKSFKVEQVDFRNNLKPRDTDTPTSTGDVEEVQRVNSVNESSNDVEQEEERVESEEEEETVEDDIDTARQDEEANEDEREEEKEEEVTVEDKRVTPEESPVSDRVLEEDSYEARKEARRREKEKREEQLQSVQEKMNEALENGTPEEDSYEARREARRKAREAKYAERIKGGGDDKPTMSYREKQQLEQAKRLEENKKKWSTMDQSNASGNVEKPAITRQKSSGAQKGAQQLLIWCQHKTKYYENVEVKDFSNSFANGLALCAILHTFVPDDIPYDDLSPDNPAENFTVALQVSEDLGIGRFFDVEDLLAVKAPDPKSMMTYLATIYQHFK